MNHGLSLTILCSLSTCLCPDVEEALWTTEFSIMRLLSHITIEPLNYKGCREFLAAFLFLLSLKGESDHCLRGTWFSRLLYSVLG